MFLAIINVIVTFEGVIFTKEAKSAKKSYMFVVLVENISSDHVQFIILELFMVRKVLRCISQTIFLEKSFN